MKKQMKKQMKNPNFQEDRGKIYKKQRLPQKLRRVWKVFVKN